MAQRAAERVAGEFFADGCPKLAAAISYYALFSLFPLAILAVAVFGLVASGDEVRSDVIEAILENVPLREQQGRQELQDLLETVTEGAGTSGILGLAALALSASAVMGAVRFGLNSVWDVVDTRPPLQGKALDVLLVAAAGLAILGSLVSTLAVQLASVLGGAAAFAVGQLAPAVLAFGVFLTLYRVVPARRSPLRDLWPGAALAAVLFALLKALFGWYLGSFADFNAVYASLATVIAFLVFVWVAASFFLLGAEVAAELPKAREDVARGDEGPDEPLLRRLAGALRGLVVRPPQRQDDQRRERRT